MLDSGPGGREEKSGTHTLRQVLNKPRILILTSSPSTWQYLKPLGLPPSNIPVIISLPKYSWYTSILISVGNLKSKDWLWSRVFFLNIQFFLPEKVRGSSRFISTGGSSVCRSYRPSWTTIDDSASFSTSDKTHIAHGQQINQKQAKPTYSSMCFALDLSLSRRFSSMAQGRIPFSDGPAMETWT